MKRLAISIIIFISTVCSLFAQDGIRVDVPNMVGLDEQFNVVFVIEGESKPSDFQWSPGADFKLVWGPQKGSSTSIQIINGKHTRSSQSTFTYILMPKSAGKFTLPVATATLGGKSISSKPVTVEVLSNGASSSSSSQKGAGSDPQDGAAKGKANQTADVSSDDIFLRLSLSKTSAVIGEPITAVLKLYQRTNIAGVDDAKFPSFTGFWSQETEAPSSIEFKRENIGDKIYNAALLRRYVLIPQQVGTLTIDPAELVCVLNVRAASSGPRSIFDSFFDDEVRQVRKRLRTPALSVKVSALPSGQPSSFGGGVGKFSMKASLAKDTLAAHEATSLVVTISGNGNVSLLEAPKPSFPADLEVYDTKATDATDRSSGGTSGSKTFEYPIIPRSHGVFTIEPVEYSYYDTAQGKYVTLRSEPLTLKVGKGKVSAASGIDSNASLSGVSDKKAVRSLGEDIRYIAAAEPKFSSSGRQFFASALFWALLCLIVLAVPVIYFVAKASERRRSDVVSARNRAATRMAVKRLRKAGEFKDKKLYSAFYEELHRGLLGFISDKFALSAEEMSRETIAESLASSGVSDSIASDFIALLDKCEYARYAPGQDDSVVDSYFDDAVRIISTIDSQMKRHKPSASALALALLFVLPISSFAQTSVDSLWTRAVSAYDAGLWSDAASNWKAIELQGFTSPQLSFNIGNALFKADDIAGAVLYYERALKADPSYKDAAFNLDFANSRIQDKIDVVPEFFLKSWLRKVSLSMRADTWAIIALFMLAIAAALALVYLLSGKSSYRKLGFFGALALLLLFAFAFSMALWQKQVTASDGKAVVMVPVSSVKSSPSAQSAKDLFVLHEGTKVLVLDKIGEWSQISLTDGRQGWISTKDIETI